jgi:hypothetical protein
MTIKITLHAQIQIQGICFVIDRICFVIDCAVNILHTLEVVLAAQWAFLRQQEDCA